MPAMVDATPRQISICCEIPADAVLCTIKAGMQTTGIFVRRQRHTKQTCICLFSDTYACAFLSDMYPSSKNEKHEDFHRIAGTFTFTDFHRIAEFLKNKARKCTELDSPDVPS
jgi:hypothetical protein